MPEKTIIKNEPKNKKQAIPLATWLLLLTILLGAWMRAEVTIKTKVDTPIRADARDYFSYAYNLNHHGIYSRDSRTIQGNSNITPPPDSLRSPGYPLFLTPFATRTPTDKTILHITLAQALLGILVILLTYITSKQLIGNIWALLPTFLVAISPQLINSGVYILSESLFTFLMAAAIACLTVQFKHAKTQWLTLLGGILLGAAAITRPTLNYIVPFLFMGLLPILAKGTRVKWSSTIMIGFIAPTLPWMLRNWFTLGGGDPTLAINSLVHGHYPWAMFEWNPMSIGYPYRFDPEIERLSSSIGSALSGIFERVMSDPMLYIHWYFLGKPQMFFSWADVASAREFFTYPTPVSPYHNATPFVLSKAFMWATHSFLVVAAAITAFVTIFRWKKSTDRESYLSIRLLTVFFIYFVLLHIAGFPIARYSTPLLPVVYMLATFGAVQVLNQLTALRSSALTASASRPS